MASRAPASHFIRTPTDRSLPTDALAAPVPKRSSLRALDYTQSARWFAALLALAALAFWPSYLSPVSAKTSFYTHMHALTATVWMLLLVAQPTLIRHKRLSLHRSIGKASYAVAPMVIASMLLLAHSRLQGLTPQAYAIQEYVLYLQVSLAIVFALAYAMAIQYKARKEIHARFMICTGLTLIDPILIRIAFWLGPNPTFNYQWVTFGLTDLVLVALIWLERNRPAPHWVLKTMLAVFVVSQLPALLSLTTSGAWRAFVAWYAALPLT